MYEKGDKIESKRLPGPPIMIVYTMSRVYLYSYKHYTGPGIPRSVDKKELYNWGVPAR